MAGLIRSPDGPSPTETLAEWVAAATYDDLPAEVISTAKRCILDSLANSIAGCTTRPGRIAMEFFQGLGGREEASILASGKRVPCIHAGYVNSFLANTLDFDDQYSGLGAGHPGATIVPPALAVAEMVHATGQEFINAVVLGYETSIRICQAINPSPARKRQVLGLGTWQVFGAAAAASKLLKLDAKQTATAFGLTGTCAPVPFAGKSLPAEEGQFHNWIKNNYGWTSMGGILGATLALHGFVGNRHFLDGDKGFWVMARSDRCDFAKFTAGLGREFLIQSVGHKPYACCRWAHSTLDAVSDILAKHHINVRDIKEIRVRAFYGAVDLGARRPRYLEDAMFSLPYLIALLLIGKSPSRGLSQHELQDPEVEALEARVISLEVDPDADRMYHEDQHQMPSTVSVTMNDGMVHAARAIKPKGDPDNPLTVVELQEKFWHLVSPVLGSDKAGRIMETVERLERLEDISMLIP